MTVLARETGVMQSTGSPSKSETAYRWIRDGIAGHQFGPGYRLVLTSIADVLEMSVVPVREALRRLEAEGLVTFERNVGARVSVVDERAYIDTMELLAVLEGSAIGLASPRVGPKVLHRALEVNQQMERLLQHFDPYTFTMLNQQFHTLLFEDCPNPQLVELVQRAWGSLAGLRDSTFSVIPERAAHSVEEHRAIVDLIRSRADPVEVEMAARQHRLRTLEAFLTFRHPDRPTPLHPEPEAP